MKKKTEQSPEKPANIVSEQAVSTVTRQYLEGRRLVGDTETVAEVIHVRKFLTEPAHILVKKGLTLNLGNMEFARVDVELRLPSYVEEIDEAHKYADKWVENKLEAEVKSVRENKPSMF